MVVEDRDVSKSLKPVVVEGVEKREMLPVFQRVLLGTTGFSC
jgi:hypothetical protein